MKQGTRETFEAEIARLRLVLKKAGIDPEDGPEALASASESVDFPADMHATTETTVSSEMVAKLEASRAALASSEARQRAIFESAVDFAMVLTDRDGIITVVV